MSTCAGPLVFYVQFFLSLKNLKCQYWIFWPDFIDTQTGNIYYYVPVHVFFSFFFLFGNNMQNTIQGFEKKKKKKKHYKNTPIQNIENLTTKKWKLSDKNFDIFHISAQNIDYWYSLELPQWGSSTDHPQSTFLSRMSKDNVYPVNPSFTI